MKTEEGKFRPVSLTSTEQWLSTWGSLAPQGIFCNVWRHLWSSQLEGQCFWHLMGRGWGRCSTSYEATKNYLPKKVQRAGVERVAHSKKEGPPPGCFAFRQDIAPVTVEK